MSKADVKEKLQKCGKLEDLKAQLLQLNEAKNQIKKIKESRTKPKLETSHAKPDVHVPALDKFEALEVQVRQSDKSELVRYS